MVSAAGCIVADPPRYEEPRRTAPILDLSRAEPPPFWIIVVDRADSSSANLVKFKVPLRSDDQGELVFFSISVDYKSANSFAQGGQPLAPSTFDDVSRFITLDWKVEPRVSPGCHQLTLLVAHQSSWDFTTQQPRPDAPADDIAIGTWWAHIDPDPKLDPYTLPNCPNQAEVER